MIVMSSKYGMLLAELFIDNAPDHPHLNNKIDYFIRFSVNDIDVNEENYKDKEDGRHDVIHTNEFVFLNDDENCGQRESFDLVMVQ